MYQASLNANVLLVSLVQDAGSMISDAILGAGLRVWNVFDSASTLSLLASMPVHLLVLDVHRIDQDALELIADIRAQPGGHALSIIALIGPLSEQGVQAIEHVDVTDFLIKPVNRARLLDAIRRYLPTELWRQADCGPD